MVITRRAGAGNTSRKVVVPKPFRQGERACCVSGWTAASVQCFAGRYRGGRPAAGAAAAAPDRRRWPRAGCGRPRSAPDRHAAWKMRKMPAASGEDACGPAERQLRRLRPARRARRHLGRGQEGGELVHAAAGDPPQHGVVGGRPGVMAAGRHALAVSSPAMRKARCSSRSNTSQTQEMVVSCFDHLGGEIAAHAIGRRLVARHHREPARLRLVVEVLHQLVELRGRRAVDGFEGDGGAARLRRRDGSAGRRARSRPASARRRRDQQTGPTHDNRAARQARRPELHSMDTPVGRAFCSLSPSDAPERSGQDGVGVQRERRAAPQAKRQSASAMALIWRP